MTAHRTNPVLCTFRDIVISSVIFVCLFTLAVMLLGNGYVSRSLHAHNPSARVVGGGGLAVGYYATPDGYVTGDCRLGNYTIDQQSTVVKTCGASPVLQARSSVPCHEAMTRPITTAPTPCYDRVQCQEDSCKFDCELSVHKHTVLVNASVTSVSSNLSTTTHNITLTDGWYDGLPELVLCDVLVQNASVQRVYINPQGTFGQVWLSAMLDVVRVGVATVAVMAICCLLSLRH